MTYLTVWWGEVDAVVEGEEKQEPEVGRPRLVEHRPGRSVPSKPRKLVKFCPHVYG